MREQIIRRVVYIYNSKKDIMANKHIRRCLTLLIIREMQMKTTVRYYLTPTRMTAIKRTENNKYC